MGNRIQILPKLAGETVPRSANFVGKLPAGVTISSQTCTATVYSGNDSNPADIIDGAATVSGTTVTQDITAGVLGCIYELLFSAVGSDGNAYKLSGYLAITPDLP